MISTCLILFAMWDAPEAARSQLPAPMEASVGRQRQAVRKQCSAKPEAESFFVLPPPGTLLTWSLLPAAAPECAALGEQELLAMVEEAAHASGLEPERLGKLVREKSAGRPCAVSPGGAQGLMQLMPAAIGQFGVADPLDPRQNLAAGARLLKQLLDSNGGDFDRALAAYNGESHDGPARGPSTTPPAPSSSAPAGQTPPAAADKNQ